MPSRDPVCAGEYFNNNRCFMEAFPTALYQRYSDESAVMLKNDYVCVLSENIRKVAGKPNQFVLH